MTPDRRALLASLAAVGVGPALFHRAVVAQVERGKAITAQMLKDAEWIAGITLHEDDRARVAAAVTSTLRGVASLREVEIAYDVPPAMHFNPLPGSPTNGEPTGTVTAPAVAPPRPARDTDLAFQSVTTLGHLIRTKQVSSRELTRLYLDRLSEYDPLLKFMVTLTDDLALKQAARADEETAAGKHRGPLHGIPWGAKDLMAIPGYKTTWGAGHYQEQVLDGTATVARKLEDAGAVLVAKLTLGALAMGDRWFGGMTRNPWNPLVGSSGSSAGSASATTAGCVGFAIGSETYGSIVSPSTRCGTTGLRPTFGRISRAGCMTLSWSLDKLGPMARSVEDCALILGTIHGADPLDPAAQTRPFHWPGTKPIKEIRVGYFEKQTSEADLAILRDIGVTLVPMTLPTDLPAGAILNIILTAECATAFDDITRAGIREGLGQSWPTTFREGRFITAVDYLRANRVRSLLIQAMDKVFENVDLYIGGRDLAITNLTGHPTICMPGRFVSQDAVTPEVHPGTAAVAGGNGLTAIRSQRVEIPSAVTMTGRLFGETDLLTVAKAYQDITGFHRKRPPAVS